MKKYLCMMDGCDYVTSDPDEAKDHMAMGEDHIMAEVSNDKDGVYCSTLK